MSRTANNIVEIGKNLHKVKQLLGYGHFGNWLRTEFNWSVATATKMMQMLVFLKEFIDEDFCRHFVKNVNFTNLNFAPSAID